MGKKVLAIILLVTILLTTGCSNSKKSAEPEVSDEFKYLKDLEDGKYYVLHEDSSHEPVCMGDPSFDAVATSPDDDRTVWYKDDWGKIPTLYKGDSLILYSKEELEETFNFERFEDMGYTVGVRNLEKTKSGRYSLATEKEKKCTYPEGDTDTLLLLKNENVILDSFAGVELRAPEGEDSDIPVLEESSQVTRCGTIKGLNYKNSYEAEVWDGTKKYSYSWKADVRVLASMQVVETNDFEFSSETIIKVTIPEDFNSGYYMINGQGLFRYVKDSKSYDDSTEFNVPNPGSLPEEDDEDIQETAVKGNAGERTQGQEYKRDIYNDEKKSTFTLNETGQIYVKVYVKAETEEMHDIEAVVETPDGQTLKMIKDGTEFTLVFISGETGIYTVKVYGLNGKEITVDAGYLEE